MAVFTEPDCCADPAIPCKFQGKTSEEHCELGRHCIGQFPDCNGEYYGAFRDHPKKCCLCQIPFQMPDVPPGLTEQDMIKLLPFEE